MFDPVDILSNQLDIYLLDGTDNKIKRYDNQLNYIQSFSLSGNDFVLPKFFTIDSRQNFYFYSFETNNIYKTRHIFWIYFFKYFNNFFINSISCFVNNFCAFIGNYNVII